MFRLRARAPVVNAGSTLKCLDIFHDSSLLDEHDQLNAEESGGTTVRYEVFMDKHSIREWTKQ